MWSRVRNWFAAPFTPRVELRVAGQRQRVRTTRSVTCVPADHQARAFLEWLQHEDGRVGEVFSHELMEMYWEMCAWHGWQVLNWQRVAHQFALLIGGASRVTRVNGRSQRVWTIPQRAPLRVANVGRVTAIHPKRVLGEMTTRVEAA